jgi:hypothetical protein
MPFTSEQKAAWNAARAESPEQEAIRAEYETGASAGRRGRKDIKIPPPKDPEVNPEVYKDVIPLLFKGFLTQAADINGVLFVFKSLNHHELEMIRLMGGYRADREVTQRFWDMFLAYGVFMVDGQNILNDRDRFVPEIAKTFSVFPPDAKVRVIRHLSELNRRANVATTLTEAYATELYSRYKWTQVAGIDLMSSTLTGVAGTDRVGLNFAQLTWRSINYYEDIYEQTERDWEHAKFVGSCFAGKGIQKVYTQDQDRRRKRKEDIFSRKDAILRYALFGDDLSDKKQQGHAVVLAARTTEELSTQLEKDLRGEKDWHDEVIEAYDRLHRDTHLSQQEQLKQLTEANDREFRGLSVVGGTGAVPLTRAEVEERITRRKQIEAQNVQRTMIETQFREKVERFNRKIAYDIPVSVEPTDRDPSDARPLTPDRTPGRPFRR